MGLWNWLMNLVFPPIQRDVSRLKIPENLVDVVLETVDVSGGPLKEHHRRRGWRDPRLLPKRAPFIRLRKRPPWISYDESKRLFSATMRTRDRRLRDLLPDEEQLRRLQLPIWKTEQDVADALGISVRKLRFYSIHRERETIQHYVTFSIPKRQGGKRLIMAPKKKLKALLRQFLELLVNRLPVSDCAHGFRVGRSVKTNAQLHVKKAFVVKFDIKDFFPTLHFGRLRGYLIAMGYGFPVATALATLMTEPERQPVRIDQNVFFVPVSSRYCIQGAPTSPGLANAIFLKADHRLYKLAQKLGYVYSRYADDLVFSGDDGEKLSALFHLVPKILREEGFAVNADKTRVMRSSNHQVITGVTVNHTLGLSKKERKLLRATIHRFAVDPARATVPRSVLQGKIAWLQMLNPSQAEKLRRQLARQVPPAMT
jgi:hypothetical protein